MNNTIETLNNIGEKKFAKTILPVKDFAMYETLNIKRCERKLTMYGLRIMLELEDYITFLPIKYNYISDDVIKDLSSGLYCIKKVPDGIYYKIVFEKKK